MPWDPDRYLTFQSERFAPFEDLLPLIRVRPGLSVVDLGCGSGELTRRLADRLPGSRVLGLDSSPAMLEKAAAQARPGLDFELRDLASVEGTWDLIFSHAALHWVEDHRSLFPRLFALLSPGGQLAVQIPSNHGHPAHRLVAALAEEEPFRTAFGGWNRVSPVLPLPSYAEILYQAGATDLQVFEKVFPQILESSDAVAAWLSGTTLVPYLERLNGVRKELFVRSLQGKLAELWPSGPVFYPFRRIFISAVRPGERP